MFKPPPALLVVGAAIVASTGTAAATTEPPATAIDTGGNPAGCVDDADPGADLFPDRFDVRHAENLTLSYEGTYKVLTVGEIAPGSGSRTYVLVQCGTEAPDLSGELAGATVVEIPVASLFSESTSHLGFIDVLGLEGAVTGVGDGSWVVTPSIRDRIDAGEVESFAPGTLLDAELVVAAAPDVLVTGGADLPEHETIADAGIPVVANAEWLETTPKGWAEWIALFAALTNTEAAANELYAGWIDGYDDAAALVGDVSERPTVLTGDLFEGIWHASGGDGIAARFIADAGGDYVFADQGGSASIQLDIETVLVEGADAEVWINPTGFATFEDALAIDDRYAGFASWDGGGVWTNAVPSDPDLAFLEQGPTMIEEYLLDYIKVLHPELVPDHEFVFFSRIES